MKLFQRACIVMVAYTVSIAEFSNSAYITSRPSGYIGCLKDSGHRILTKQLSDSGKNTGDNCKRHCQAEGYRYAGTQVGSQCFCGNCLHSNIEKSGCNDTCSGNRTEYCGGFWRLSIYDTWPCVLKPCTNGTNCIKVFDDSPNKYSCNCSANWTSGYCNKAVDECKNGPCIDGATCVDEIDGFRCMCGPNSTTRQCANETAHVTTNAIMCPSTLTTPPSTTAVSTTIKPPVITRSPSSSSRPPPSSSRLQSYTSRPPPFSARPPSSTSRSPPFKTRPPSSTSRPPPFSARPPSSTSRSPPFKTRPPSSTSRPPPFSARPPSSTSRSPPFKTRPPSSSSRPPPFKTRPPSSTSRSPPFKTRPPSSTSRPPPFKTRPPSSTSRPPPFSARPPSSTSRLKSSLTRPPPSTSRLQSSTSRSQPSTTRPHPSTTRVSSSTIGPSLSTATPLTSTTRTSTSTMGSSLSTAIPLTSTMGQSFDLQTYTINGWKTINNTQFRVVETRKKYSDASDYCMNMSAKLLSYTNPLRYDLLSSLIRLKSLTYWIGVYMDSLGNECPVLTMHGSESRIRLEYCNQTNVFICSRIVNISDVIHDVEFIEMIKDMTVNVKQTNRAKRKLISTEDSRRSSTFIGGSGIIIICAVFAFVMLADINWKTCKK